MTTTPRHRLDDAPMITDSPITAETHIAAIPRNMLNARKLAAYRILADIILELDNDILETTLALRELLSPIDFDAICFSCDICPMHICDSDSCADDNLSECADLR